jgi:hypothetical protein
MGQELSHVQFRSLEEQLHRCMRALFDQEQRQCVVRLVGMKAPASLFTPFVSEPPLSEERLQRFVVKQLERWPFAMKAAAAYLQLNRRDTTFVEDMLRRGAAAIEPQTVRRRLR